MVRIDHMVLVWYTYGKQMVCVEDMVHIWYTYGADLWYHTKKNIF